jgi:hypothetical protein
VLVAIALIVINLLILAQMRRMTQRRVSLASHCSATDTSVIFAMKAERKRSILIVLTGVNYIGGHTLFVVFQIFFYFFINQNDPWYCVKYASTTLLLTAYASPFFFYYFFNTQFFKYANRNLQFMFFPVWRVMELVKGIQWIRGGRRNTLPTDQSHF